MAEKLYEILAKRKGRPLAYDTPEALLNAAVEYFQWNDNRTDWNKQNWVGKEGNEVVVKVVPPLSKASFYVFAGITRQTFENYKEREGFFTVCTYIEDVISSQKFEGAATFHYNHSIIAMEMGLKNKLDITSDDEKLEHITYEVVLTNKEPKSE